MINVRPSVEFGQDAVREIILPVIQAGNTYALPEDWTKAEALAYWYAPPHRVFVAEEDGRILGTYFLQPNQRGGGDHIANCGYITRSDATGRGVASAMCAHSLAEAQKTAEDIRGADSLTAQSGARASAEPSLRFDLYRRPSRTRPDRPSGRT